MKCLLSFLLLCLVGGLPLIAHSQDGAAPSMGQPGFYGRIEIGDYQQPPLLFSNAVMGNPGVFSGQPLYMHVPPEHAYHWSSHCQRYGACDWMVYFVDNGWYNTVYVPGFRSGVFGYAPPPVYVGTPLYRVRPYYVAPPPPLDRPPPPHVRPPPPGSEGRPPPPRPEPYYPPSGKPPRPY